MIKQFFKDSVIYGIGKILTFSITFFMVPLYTRIFTPADFGIIDIITITSNLVMITVALEIGQGAIRFVIDTNTRIERIEYTSTALWFSIIAYSAFIFLAILFSDPLSLRLFGEDGQQPVFHIAVLMMASSGLFNLAQNLVRFQFKPKHYMMVSLLNTIISLFFIIVLVVFMKIGVVGVFWGRLIGFVIGAGFALYVVRDDIQPVFMWLRLKEMLRFSTPLVFSSISVFTYLYIDRFMVKEMLSMTDLGLLGIGYRISSIVNLLLFGVQLSFIPLVYQHHSEPQTPHQLARVFRYFMFMILLLVTIISIFAFEILHIFTTEAYYSAWKIVPVLLPSTLLASMYIFAPGLGISKKTGMITLINVTGAVLNIVLNLFLIPSLGIQGAAISTLISTTIVFLLFMLSSQKTYYVPHHWSGIGIAIFATFLTIIAGIYVQLNLSLWLSVSMRLLFSFALCGILIFLGLIEYQELKNLKRYIMSLLKRGEEA